MTFKVFLNTLLLLLGSEGAARIAEWIHPPVDDLTFEYAPYRMLKMSHTPWQLNRDGFRARELETYRHAFLIEFLGGSVCLGVGTNPGLTVPERLEIALHRAGLVRAQVLNLCQGGATSAQELAIFLEYGLPLARHRDAACALWHGLLQDTGRSTPHWIEAKGEKIIRHWCRGRDPSPSLIPL